ncbi:hypothetical protein [Streptomyces rapamycinicus]|uniref:Uncharacterized protein n=1 Tax=Streptomyces rapamycinicus TaxID=1226757 RepID=A0ABR6LVT1_9ACTN|nr:hypothetical protein [Streptomyces rapamycinicus]MBB4786441.1 hypothetical protein [Streptomyces rapamycinicus]
MTYDTEPGYDHVIVEARTASQDDWTTRPRRERRLLHRGAQRV